MDEKKFLESYSGQSAYELLEMAKEYRVDSLVLAFEQAIKQKAEQDRHIQFSKLEHAILAIEALEREVNNGGYDQFFLNNPEHVPNVVELLQYVGLPITAQITEKAIMALQIDKQITIEAVQEAMDEEDDQRDEILSTCDDKFFAYEEDIATTLFNFIENHRNDIHID